MYIFNASIHFEDFSQNIGKIYYSSLLIAKGNKNNNMLFNTLVFEEENLDIVYPPRQYFLSDNLIENIRDKKADSRVIKFKNYEETLLEGSSEALALRWSFAITPLGLGFKGPYRLHDKQRTQFIVDFDEEVNINQIHTWIETFINVYKFIFKRSKVYFKSIEASLKKVNHSDFTYFDHSNIKNDTNIENKVQYPLRIDYFYDSLSKIIEVSKSNLIYTRHFPKDLADESYIDLENVIFTASAFEFELEFLDFEDEKDKYTNQIIENTCLDLDTSNESLKGVSKDKRKVVSRIKDYLLKYSKSLEFKINSMLKIHEKDLKNLSNYFSQNLNLKPESINIGNEFSSLRNLVAHGGKHNFSNENIFSFIIVSGLVYNMSLVRFGVHQGVLNDSELLTI